jgi:hypothetical protein
MIYGALGIEYRLKIQHACIREESGSDLGHERSSCEESPGKARANAETLQR